MFKSLPVKSVTRSGLTLFLTVAYVYLALALIFLLLRVFLRALIDLVGWSNAFGLRNAIAGKEVLLRTGRGCPLNAYARRRSLKRNGRRLSRGLPIIGHRIPSLPYRVLRAAASYLLLFLIMAALLQLFTPIPVITWLAALTRMVLGRAGAA